MKRALARRTGHRQHQWLELHDQKSQSVMRFAANGSGGDK